MVSAKRLAGKLGISGASQQPQHSRPPSAQHTPLIRPDRIRKAPMYWFTRSVITSQPAITTMTVMKAVSSTSHKEITNQRSYNLQYTGAPQEEPSVQALLTMMEMRAGG